MALKAGNLFIADIRAPDTVPQGESFTIEVDVANGAVHIPAFDPDSCGSDENPCGSTGTFETKGYCVEFEFDPFWTAPITRRQCIQIAFSGVGMHTFTAEIDPPPNPGAAVTQLTLRAAGTDESETQDLEVTIESDNGDPGDIVCNSDDDCPDDLVCQNGDCVEPDTGQPPGNGDGTCPDGTIERGGECVPAIDVPLIGPVSRDEALLVGGAGALGVGLIALSGNSGRGNT